MKNSIFLHSYPHLLTDYCWDISQGKVFQEFQNWGSLYTVEFEITVTTTGPGNHNGWTNVFHFTANDNYGDYGDRIPALWINIDGYFHICSTVSGNHNRCYQKNDYELGKQYQITIKQFIANGTYWYQIIIDGESMLMIENTQPQSFSSVRLYTSDPWYTSFTFDFGSICNVKIQQGEGKIFLISYNF